MIVKTNVSWIDEGRFCIRFVLHFDHVAFVFCKEPPLLSVCKDCYLV